MHVTGLVRLTGTTSVLASGANAYLRLISTATAFASVNPLNAGSSITGDVKVESWLTGGTLDLRHTRMLSPPVNDNYTLAGNKIYQQLKNQLVITGPDGNVNGFDPGNASQPNAVTLTRYNEPNTLMQSQFAPIPSLTDAMVPVVNPGEGFFLFYRGNRGGYTTITNLTSNKVNQPFAVPESFAVTYQGRLNQGNIAATLNRTPNAEIYDGFNVIGNPYPASIDFTQLSINNSAAIENYYVIVKPDKSGIMSYSAASGTVTNGSPFATNSTARYIQSAQAFYIVKKVNGTETFSNFFTESIKATANLPARLLAVPFGRNLQTLTSMSLTPLVSVKSNPWPLLRMSLQDDINIDEAAVLFRKGYRKEYEGSDVPYFSGSTVSLSTLSADEKSLAINFMPDLKEMTIIKLAVYAQNSGLFKLSFFELPACLPSQKMFLKDSLYPDRLTELKLNLSYSFIIDKNISNTFGTDRFKIALINEKKLVVKKPSAVKIATLISYPNPFTDKFVIKINDKIKGGMKLLITSIQGRNVKEFDFEVNENLTVDLSGYQSGMYAVELRSAMSGRILGRSIIIKN